MNNISVFVIPILVLIITIYGFCKKVNLYDSFIAGAKEGLTTTISIFPYVMGMIFAINIFLTSNFIPTVLSRLAPFFDSINLPVSVLPMALLRPISGTATLAILNDIFASLGPDSFAGRLGSTLQACTDTTFYVITLYFGSIGVSKTRYALKAGLFADLVGVIMAFLIVYLIFG